MDGAGNRASPAGAEDLDRGWRSDEDRSPTCGASHRISITRRRPAQQACIHHEVRRIRVEHERAVRQIVHRRLVMSLAARGGVDALRMELGVDGVRACLVRMDRAPDLHEPHVVISPTECARAMAGGERGRLVQEEQLREPAGLHQRRAVPPAERQPAGDPALPVEPPPDDAGIVVQAAAVPVDGATCRIGDQVAERCHPIPLRHRPVRSRRTFPRPRAPERPSMSRATPRTRRGAVRPRHDRVPRRCDCRA